MQQSGEHRIGAPREAVWRALNDPGVLAQCIDGCESLTQTGDDTFDAVVRARVGPLSATFTGQVKIVDPDPPNSYRLEGGAKGGAAGFGKGGATVTLTDDGGGTLLRYEVQGSVGGKLAQVGQRLVDGAARKMADDFFARFSEIVAPAESDMLAGAVASPAPRADNRLAWTIGAALLAVAALVAIWMLR